MYSKFNLNIDISSLLLFCAELLSIKCESAFYHYYIINFFTITFAAAIEDTTINKSDNLLIV